jgi:hypothetical protein
MSLRYVHNMALIEELTMLVKGNPDLRFGQILRNFGFVATNSVKNNAGDIVTVWHDEFNVEPDDLLKRVREYINLYMTEPSEEE